VKCLKQNLEAFENSIEFYDLPATLRDSITLCYSVGLRYIRIDALCIVQDDDTDKSTEIAKMHHVYSSSYLTIAASRSFSVTEGFLRERSLGQGCYFKLPWRCGNGQLGSVDLIQLADPDGPEPLDRRAWALQERALSRRIVDFSTLQTLWYCQVDSWPKVDGWKRRPEFPLTKQIPLGLRPLPNPVDIDVFHAEHYLDRIRGWTNIVKVYSQRSLTVKKDRVLAISGIDEVFAQVMGSGYISGIWKSNLPTELCWRVDIRTIQARPATYQGPSWSWTSVDGAIICWGAGNDARYSNITANVIDYSAILENELAPFGAVRDGSARLIIRGKTASGKLIKRTPDETEQYATHYYLELTIQNDTDCKKVRVDVAIDAEELTAHELPVTILEICNQPRKYCSGLVLRWVQSRGIKQSSSLSHGEPKKSRKPFSGLGKFFSRDSKRSSSVSHIESNKKIEVFSRIGMFDHHARSWSEMNGETWALWEKRASSEVNLFKDCELKTIEIV
jgi:hypothetical protein